MSHLYSNDLYGSETYSETTSDVAAGQGTYNEIYYNENVYNAAILVLALFESLTTTDGTKTVDDFTAVKAELLTLVDNLQRYFNGAILSETVTPSDVILNQAQISKLDLLSVTDALTATVLKSLLETMTLADVRTMVFSTNLNEFVLLVDSLSKFISNKRVDETLRLQDWLSVKKRPAGNIWSN